MLLTFGGKALGRFCEDLHLMQNRSLAAVGWEQNYPGLWEKLTNLASQKRLSCVHLEKMQQCLVSKAEVLGIRRKENFVSNHLLHSFLSSLGSSCRFSLSIFKIFFWFIERLYIVQSSVPYCANQVCDLV